MCCLLSLQPSNPRHAHQSFLLKGSTLQNQKEEANMCVPSVYRKLGGISAPKTLGMRRSSPIHLQAHWPGPGMPSTHTFFLPPFLPLDSLQESRAQQNARRSTEA